MRVLLCIIIVHADWIMVTYLCQYLVQPGQLFAPGTLLTVDLGFTRDAKPPPSTAFTVEFYKWQRRHFLTIASLNLTCWSLS